MKITLRLLTILDRPTTPYVREEFWRVRTENDGEAQTANLAVRMETTGSASPVVHVDTWVDSAGWKRVFSYRTSGYRYEVNDCGELEFVGGTPGVAVGEEAARRAGELLFKMFAWDFED